MSEEWFFALKEQYFSCFMLNYGVFWNLNGLALA